MAEVASVVYEIQVIEKMLWEPGEPDSKVRRQREKLRQTLTVFSFIVAGGVMTDWYIPALSQIGRNANGSL